MRGILGNQFDRRRWKIRIVRLKFENRATRGTAQILTQPQFSTDRLPFPLLPRLGHGTLCELVAVFSAHNSPAPRKVSQAAARSSPVCIGTNAVRNLVSLRRASTEHFRNGTDSASKMAATDRPQTYCSRSNCAGSMCSARLTGPATE